MEKQKKVELLLGQMEFGEFVVSGDRFKIALVHSVAEKLLVDEDKAMQIGEEGLDRADSYLIPSLFKGDVWFSRNAWQKCEEAA